MRGISHFSIKRPVTTTMLIIAMLISGLLGLSSMRTELMPDFTIPIAIVTAPWVGASPEDVEVMVTQKLEEAIIGIDGIRRINSYSYQDSSFIIVQLNYGEDIDKKIRDIQRRVDNIRDDLPSDVSNVNVSDFDINAMPIINYYLYGDSLDELKNIAEDRVKPALQKIPGVGDVTISGGFEEEILVEIDPIRAESYGVSILQIFAILQNSNINLPLGTIADSTKEYVIRVLGEIKTIDEVRNIVISNEAGNIVRLRDVAEVKPSFKDITSYARQNGQDTLNISVVKTKEGNVVDVAKAVRDEIDSLTELLPNNLTFVLGDDNSKFIETSIGTVTNNALMGLILASVILFIFLKNGKATLIIALAIPTSIIGTFLLLSAMDISLNVISLMGLALGVGMLVDNSVVVLDNIFRHITELGEDIETGAANGASEMAVPIVASTATTVSVFLPLMIREGMAKEIFTDMSYSIAFSLLASLFVALTFVPMLSSRFLNINKSISSTGKLFELVKRGYDKILNVSLKHRIKVLILTILLSLGIIFFGFATLGFEMMPSTDEGRYTINASLPKGFDIEKANSIALEIEKVVYNNSFTKEYSTIVNKDSISVNVDIGDKGDRRESVNDVVAFVRRELNHIRDASFTVSPVQSMGGGGGGGSSDIALKILGDDTEQVRFMSEIVLNEIRKIDGLVDIKSSFEGGNPQAQIYIDRVRAQYYGVRVGDIVPLIATQVRGSEAFTITDNNREIDVTVRVAKEYRDSPQKLLELPLTTPMGNIALKEIASIKIVEGPTFIEKEDRLINVTLSANLDGIELREANSQIRGILEEIEFPRGVSYNMGGVTEDLVETMTDLLFALGIAIFLIYFILAAQFESFILPFIIMGSVPLSISGVVIGLVITQFKFDIMVMIGIIMLAGIVVNNAIVLIDYINLLRAKGNGLLESVRESAETRLRPILMTTMTTAFGMTPLAFGLGDGSEIYQGMAIAVIFGLIFSTVLTLIYIPSLYLLIENKKEKRREKSELKKKKRRETLFKS